MAKNKEEVLLCFKKNQQTHLQLNIVNNLQSDLGRGDASIANGRKSLSAVIDGYQSAIPIYNEIISQADKYILMAKSLGEAGIEKSLNQIKKEAGDMIKLCTSAISKLKAI